MRPRICANATFFSDCVVAFLRNGDGEATCPAINRASATTGVPNRPSRKSSPIQRIRDIIFNPPTGKSIASPEHFDAATTFPNTVCQAFIQTLPWRSRHGCKQMCIAETSSCAPGTVLGGRGACQHVGLGGSGPSSDGEAHAGRLRLETVCRCAVVGGGQAVSRMTEVWAGSPRRGHVVLPDALNHGGAEPVNHCSNECLRTMSSVYCPLQNWRCL